MAIQDGFPRVRAVAPDLLVVLRRPQAPYTPFPVQVLVRYLYGYGGTTPCPVPVLRFWAPPRTPRRATPTPLPRGVLPEAAPARAQTGSKMPGLRRGRSAVRDAAVEEDLTCPLCLELPEGEVQCCTNGHNFCGDCLGRHRAYTHGNGNSRCPTCRVDLAAEPIRNRDAEQRIGRLPGSCTGCGAGMLRNVLTPHMATCEAVEVECPFPGCSVRVARGGLAAHLVAASDGHIQLAQGLASRVRTAEGALASMKVYAEVGIYSARDVVEGNWEGRAYDEQVIELTVMEPIAAQEDFRSYVSENDLDLTRCAVSVDISKSPFELGVEAIGQIRISTTVIPAHLRPRVPEAPIPGENPIDAINLKVLTEDGDEIFFKCKMSTELDKLMAAFCNRLRVSRGSCRFLFDGGRILPHMTPQELEMEDGDVIDVIIEEGARPAPVPVYR